MRIADLFRRDINRTIEEVVKVDLADEAVIAGELDEYVATTHILEEFEKVLDAYQESVNNPNESCTVWVSGFFGSGKSSWAKVLGYLLWNPAVQGRTAAERFFGRTQAPRLKALLSTIHAQAPTVAVLLNLATGSNVVAKEGESVVYPSYRALLNRLGYSPNFTLAELEFALEGDGQLAKFEQAFFDISRQSWNERRYTALAKRDAMKALDAIYGDSSAMPRWATELEAPDVNADWFVPRAIELLERRGNAAKRLMFIVDEAGQYVARSVQRMLDLQGLAEAFQKRKGRLWLTVTSQEKLNDVVDSLESKQVELARAQARFPLRVDLLPTDIDEVTGKRVLDKTDEGQRVVRNEIQQHRQKLHSNTRLSSPTRASDPSEEELVRLYPLLPYQIQLLIDAVSVRRAHRGASPTIGGSNRTIIKHAQQLIVHPRHGLVNELVGALVTMDRSYELLHENIPTSWRAEVEQVTEKYGSDSTEAKAIRVVALCSEVHALPMTASNISVLLHPAIAAEALRDQVASALTNLVADDRLRETDDGYKLQSPEQKDWEKTRRAIDLAQGPSVRLRRFLLKQVLSALTVGKGRAFKVGVSVEGEEQVGGEVQLEIEEADSARREAIRQASREAAHQNRITWVYELSDETWNSLTEMHRSRTMIERRDTPNKTAEEIQLLGEERERMRRHESGAIHGLKRDLAAGQVIFRGLLDNVEEADLREMAHRVTSDRLPDVYPQLNQFNASLRKEEVLRLLRTTDLGAVPEALQDEGIGLVRASPTGYELVTESGPLALLASLVRTRTSYGHEATGSYLENHFAAPPYGAPTEVVQAVCAAGVRAGLLEVIHQGQRVTSAGDVRLDQVFATLPRFRAAAFRPPADTDLPLNRRVDLAEKLEHLTGNSLHGTSTSALAEAVRNHFLSYQQRAIRAESALRGLGMPVPNVIVRTREILDRLDGSDDLEVVTTAHQAWADLAPGCTATSRLDELVSAHLEELRAAHREAERPALGLSEKLQRVRDELRDVLASGDLATHFARITSLSNQLRAERHTLASTAATRLTQTVDSVVAGLKGRFVDMEPALVEEAARPLLALYPPADLDLVDAALLEERINSALGRAAGAAHQLEELRSAGRIMLLRIADLVAGPITSEEEIEPVLQRIREAIAAELAEGKHVRLE